MTISHDLKMIFIHAHRTGGTCVSNLLSPYLTNNFENSIQHNNAKTLDHSFFEKYSNYFTFGYTRNPWERILSWYSLIHLTDQKSLPDERMRLQKFIETDAAADFNEQFFHYNTIDYYSNKKNELIVDKIYRFENFEKETKALFEALNLPLSEIPLINETNPKNYKDYYTDKSKDLIAEKCERDITYFGYKF